MNKREFAFIVHSRDRSDLPRRFPFLKCIPNSIFDFITKNLPPFIVSNITGLVKSNGDQVTGMLIGVPMTARQLLEDRKLALKRIISAIKLAKSKGAKYIGLGAMTSSLTSGGNDIISNIDEIFVTTGRTYTIKNITDYIFRFEKDFNFDRNSVCVGIVGAAGGIGYGVSLMLAKNNYKNFVLVDLERKLTALKEKIRDLENNANDLKIEITHLVSSVAKCNIIVAATSAPEVIIQSADVSSGTVIINDAQPSDISPEIIKNRKDVLVVEGGVLNAPGMNCHFNMGLSRKDDIFSCLAETLILAHTNDNKHYSMTSLDLSFLDKITKVGDKLKFNNSAIQNNNGIVSQDYINNFKKFLNK